MPEKETGTFWDHVYSLRSHILLGGLCFVAIAIGIFMYEANTIVSYLLVPLHGEQLVFLSPLGPFLFSVQISIYAGIALSLPFWLGLLLHFVFPALTQKQKLVASLFILFSFLLTIVSAKVTYSYLVPATLHFLLGFTVPGTSFLLTADSYISFVLLQGIVTFFIFQLPLIIVLLSYLGIFDPHFLARKRRFLYPFLLTALAILTPTTDAVTLTLVSIPAALLMETGILIGKAVYKKGNS